MSRKSGVADRQVRIGGKSYTLRFSVKAMAALQAHWGLASISDVGSRLDSIRDGMGIDDLIGIFWAGLRAHHGEMDKEDVLDLVDDAGFDGLTEVLASAIGDSLPEAGGEAKGTADVPPRKAGRSRAS